MTEQLYLIKISAMMASDECDIVPSAEIVVDSDFATLDAPILEALPKLANSMLKTLVGIPVSNIRPMTRDEISVWRADQSADDGIVEL